MRTVIAVLALASVPASASEIPDLLGTWQGTSRAVTAGAGGHYADGEATPGFRAAELTIEWTDQDDGRLIGTITSAGHSEMKIGVVSSSGETLVTADEDGSSIGRIVDENHFELCYTQSSAGDQQLVASCVDFERVAE